ncbi:MAG TPA: hypothetical protein VET30_07275 [Pseudoxanthomonas sp.]|nr:hypothetical protein [Pseudoxanthomonas sp.]
MDMLIVFTNFWHARGTNSMKPRLLLFCACVATVLVYWMGLFGPFLLDDLWNLKPVVQWHAGKASLYEAVFPQESLVSSRPLAMASFVLTTWLFGPDSFSFKFGNLIVHLACGITSWVVLRRILVRDACLANHAGLLATLVATIWLLHPLHVSTVLYSVQRMAQLSTLFTLAAVWCYLIARQQLEQHRDRAALLNLFIVFPLMVLLGVLSKQNAVVAPALCLIVEAVYFQGSGKRPRSLKAFFTLFLAVPAVAGLALLIAAPDRLLAGYAEWDFTLWQRLMTQSRALMDYIGMLVIPRGPLMGLYTDDFVVSQGLLSPLSTLFCILALIGITICAFVLRRRAPSILAGWLFFLVAHSVESTIVPLEMYYEHRNYLPSLGLFLATLGLLGLVISKVQTNFFSVKQLGWFATAGFILVLGVSTFGRVLIWKDMGGITAQAEIHHPKSRRLRSDMASEAVGRGDYDGALAALAHLLSSDNPRYRQVGNLGTFTIRCLRGDANPDTALLETAAKENLHKITTYEAQSFVRLTRTIKAKGCGSVRPAVAASYVKRILDSASSQPESAQPKWHSRTTLADLYASAEDWPAARQQAEISWEGSGHFPKVGASLTSLYVQEGNIAAARTILAEIRKRVAADDTGGQATLRMLQKSIDDANARAQSEPSASSRKKELQ